MFAVNVSRNRGCSQAETVYVLKLQHLLVFPEFGVEEMTMPGLLHHWNFRSANQSHTFVGTRIE